MRPLCSHSKPICSPAAKRLPAAASDPSQSLPTPTHRQHLLSTPADTAWSAGSSLCSWVSSLTSLGGDLIWEDRPSPSAPPSLSGLSRLGCSHADNHPSIHTRYRLNTPMYIWEDGRGRQGRFSKHISMDHGI